MEAMQTMQELFDSYSCENHKRDILYKSTSELREFAGRIKKSKHYKPDAGRPFSSGQTPNQEAMWQTDQRLLHLLLLLFLEEQVTRQELILKDYISIMLSRMNETLYLFCPCATNCERVKCLLEQLMILCKKEELLREKAIQIALLAGGFMLKNRSKQELKKVMRDVGIPAESTLLDLSARIFACKNLKFPRAVIFKEYHFYYGERFRIRKNAEGITLLANLIEPNRRMRHSELKEDDVRQMGEIVQTIEMERDNTKEWMESEHRIPILRSIVLADSITFFREAVNANIIGKEDIRECIQQAGQEGTYRVLPYLIAVWAYNKELEKQEESNE